MSLAQATAAGRFAAVRRSRARLDGPRVRGHQLELDVGAAGERVTRSRQSGSHLLRLLRVAEERDPAMAAVQKMLHRQLAAAEVVDDDRPALSVIADAVDEHHRHAAVLQHREARALLIDRRDDDALHPRLHQQVEVVAFPHGVVAAVAEDHTGAELGAALLGAECDVDEERVVEVGDREPERAHPTGSELPRPLAGHEVEFADRREYAFAGLGVDVRRSVEDIADRAGGDASEGGDVFDGRHHSPSFGDSFNEPVYGSESGVGRSRRRRGPGNTAATRPD